jgi:hypothetical protein
MKILITSFLCFFVSFQTIAQTQTNSDTIYWSSCYKLKVEDFKGQLDSTSEFDAISSIKIDYDITQQSFGKITGLKAFCFFKKSESKAKNMDSTLLTHEQIHFNIAELYTRKLRKNFSEYLKLKKSLSLDEAQTIYFNIKNEYKKITEQYDLETDYSKNRIFQKKWTSMINTKLLLLKQYSK